VLELPTAWKILGDELVFVVEIDGSSVISLWIEAFQETLLQWNDEVRKGPESERGCLLVKGAAWLAGFPVMNTVFQTAGGGRDFAGPSVDAGFRLGGLATPRRLAVSVDLGWLLLRCQFPRDIHFDGPAFIKGVAEESGYPSLWIEVGSSEYVRYEAQLLGRGEQNDQSAVEKLCLAFIEEYGVPSHAPFLAGEQTFTPQPNGYDQDLGNAREWLRTNVYLVEDADEGSVLAPVAEQDAILQRLRRLKKE
jgi:hypothetical protein